MDKTRIEYEITGGELVTPVKGEISIPPEKCTRKDIEVGGFVIKVEVTPKAISKKVEEARKMGITEIPNPAEATKTSDGNEIGD